MHNKQKRKEDKQISGEILAVKKYFNINAVNNTM